MGCVLLVVHQHRDEALKLARDAVAWLTSSGHEVRLPPEDATVLGRSDLVTGEPATVPFDLAVSIGGDGTMLRTVELVAANDVPVLGIHVGQALEDRVAHRELLAIDEFGVFEHRIGGLPATVLEATEEAAGAASMACDSTLLLDRVEHHVAVAIETDLAHLLDVARFFALAPQACAGA